ncbi:sigma-E factor negative regulatory protein [Microbulbifer agarilyticus]|uniref:sigma-E factor negative regulatory protein n=1 Tax=Microbulbifer agarilyticus TaxID=260552 RepID=UPI001C93CCA1|nr:sigma-E factor negative regulatory protein [Microbulbifer agarilyticus]MBY6189761.1 sigma-E factor negative regulatory protein [Microbulbifer agarilyticus]MBY6211066.1 sigma-E factor negative regulatory protein [Microbulbifer agarilyticus]MCA0892292.1 sigma-E factor negative regulatory protein [Microbulbifer agarilyticus]
MSHGSHQQRLNESLSALMDGEANELEIQRLLKESDANGASDGELGHRWSRYQLAASVMRGEKVAPVDMGLAASISAAIADEPSLESAQQASANDAGNGVASSRWWRPLSRGAVAATVAFAAILGVQQMQAPQVQGDLVAEVEAPQPQPVTTSPQPSRFLTPTLNTRAVSTAPQLVPEQRVGPAPQVQVVPTPELMRHLNRVMVEHSEQAARIGSQGMVPHARATYGERPSE